LEYFTHALILYDTQYFLLALCVLTDAQILANCFDRHGFVDLGDLLMIGFRFLKFQSFRYEHFILDLVPWSIPIWTRILEDFLVKHDSINQEFGWKAKLSSNFILKIDTTILF